MRPALRLLMYLALKDDGLATIEEIVVAHHVTAAVFAKADVTFGDDLTGVGGKAAMRVSW